MQSIIQKKSYGSVKVFCLDRTLLKKKVTKIIHKRSREKPEVQKVILFGSVAEDRALPSSDVDLLLSIDNSNERFIDRSSHYLPYFQTLPMDVECFVYTNKEVRSGNYPIIMTALEKGIVLFERSVAGRQQGRSSLPSFSE